MSIKRDWITISEQAQSEGLTDHAIYKRIWRGTLRLPYVQVGGPNGTTLIYNPGAATCPIVNEPGTKKAQKQVNFDETACNRAQNR